MPSWTNADGLVVKYGQDEVTPAKAGEYNIEADYHMTELRFDAIELGTGQKVFNDNVTVPKGARINKVEVIAETAATSGGSAVLNVGFVDQDQTTPIDIDGLVAALPLANINVAGEYNQLTAGVTYAGALVGTTLSNAGLLTADYDTAAFTGGRIVVRVYWYVPAA